MSSIIDLVGGAAFTEFGLFVEEFRRSTSAFAFRGGNGVRRAADFEGPSGVGSSRTDALEESAVKDVASGAAVEARALVVAQGECL